MISSCVRLDGIIDVVDDIIYSFRIKGEHVLTTSVTTMGN